MDLPLDFEWRFDKKNPTRPDQGAFRCGSWMEGNKLYGSLDFVSVRNRLGDLARKGRVTYIGHNVNADLTKMVEWGIPLARDWSMKDSMLAARLLDPLQPAKDLKTLARQNGWIYNEEWDNEDLDTLLDYCGKDTFTSHEILAHYQRDLCPDKRRVLDFTFDLARAFFGVEQAGIKLDMSLLDKRAADYSNKLSDHIIKGVDPDLITNDRMFRDVLHRHYKHDVLKKTLGLTKNKDIQVSAKKLKLLPNQQPWMQRLVDARADNDYRTLYVMRPLELAKSGFFFPRYRLLFAKTQRRSTEPAIQNWPAEARQAVISRFPHGRILTNDFKNLEARLFAWQSGCKSFLEALVEGGYPLVGHRCFKWPMITKKDPRYKQLKALVLAVTYNMGVGLYKNNMKNDGVELSWDQAQEHFDEFFNVFPEIDKEMRDRKAYVWKHGKIKSSVPGVDIPVSIVPDYVFDTEDNYKWYCKKIENFACNYPTQSLASYVTGAALVDIQNGLAARAGGWGPYIDLLRSTLSRTGTREKPWFPIAEVHDELVCDVSPGKMPEAKETMLEMMTKQVTLKKLIPGFNCPLNVDQEEGEFWSK